MQLPLVLLIASFIGVCCEPSLTSNEVPALFEHFVRQLGEDKDYRLPEIFRDERGNFKEGIISTEGDAAITTTPCAIGTGPTACKTDSNSAGLVTCGTIAATGSYPSLTYQFQVPTGVISPYVFCLYLSSNLNAIQLNTLDGKTAKIATATLSPANGITCNNCYAYVGANIGFSLKSLVTVGVTTTFAYGFAFTASGATAFNFNFALKDPTISTSASFDILPVPADGDTIDYTTLFADVSSGITIQAYPALTVATSGSGSTTGSASLTAAYSTSATIGASVKETTANIGFSTSTDVPLSSTTSSTLKFTGAIKLTTSAISTIYWKIGITNPIPAVNPSVSALFTTPITLSYSYANTPVSSKKLSTLRTEDFHVEAASTCTTTPSLSIAGNFNGMSAGVGEGVTAVSYSIPSSGYSLPLGTATVATQAQTSPNLCLNTAYTAPTKKPSTSSASSSFAGAGSLAVISILLLTMRNW